MAFSESELRDMQLAARVSSIVSLLGCAYIILTFCIWPAFRKPINRLAFFACFGNIMTNIATIIARGAIPEDGSMNATCQFQSVLIQWFMPADALFCAAMALNVYLTVFREYIPSQLQKLEIYYVSICYGLPFIPALVLLFIRKPNHGSPLYGNATLWCWISNDWQAYRIILFYGPVWVVLIGTFTIYIISGARLYQKNRIALMRLHSYNAYAQAYDTNYVDIPVTPSCPASSFPPNAADTSPPSSPPLSPLHSAHTSATSTTLPVPPLHSPSHRRSSLRKSLSTLNLRASVAGWAYTKCALLFFAALLITWLPASGNRLSSVIHPGQQSFGWNFAAALVLPGQGFWNGVIYAVTTMQAARDVVRRRREKRDSRQQEVQLGQSPVKNPLGVRTEIVGGGVRWDGETQRRSLTPNIWGGGLGSHRRDGSGASGTTRTERWAQGYGDGTLGLAR